MENAVVILQSTQAPLIIDLSAQASEWLKATSRWARGRRRDGDRDEGAANKLELAVRFGKTLIVEEVDKIEPILYSVVRKDLERQGMRWVVHVGDKTVDYNESFRMFLVTRNPYPAIPPSAASVVAEVNFTVTRSGLEGQLLGLVIQHEQPALEKQKSHLLRVEEDLKVQLAGLEKTLWRRHTSTEHPRERRADPESDETKAKGTTVKESLEESTTLRLWTSNARRIAHRQQGSKILPDPRFTRAEPHVPVQSELVHRVVPCRSPERAVVRSDRRHALARCLTRLRHVGRSVFNADRLTFGMPSASSREGAGSGFELLLRAGPATRPRGRPAQVGPQEVSRRYANLVGAFPAIASAYDLEDGGKWAAGCGRRTRAAFSGARTASRFRRLSWGRRGRTASPLRCPLCAASSASSPSRPSLCPCTACASERLVAGALHRHARVGPGPGARGARRPRGEGRYHQLAMGQGQAEGALRLLHSARGRATGCA